MSVITSDRLDGVYDGAGGVGYIETYRESLRDSFRASGGKVIALYYGDWGKTSLEYNQSPWRPFKYHPERIPTKGQTWLDTLTYSFSTNVVNGFQFTNCTGQLNAASVTISSTGSDPILLGPILPRLDGDYYTTCDIKIKRVAGAGWDGQFLFTTWAAPSYEAVNKRIALAEPTWDGSFKTISVNLVGNAYWTGDVPKNARFDFGNSASDVFEVESIIFNTTSKALSDLKIKGLDSAVQGNADYEIYQSYAAGIDVFMHCFYWSKGNNEATHRNFTKPSLTAHVASTAAPEQKFCLMTAGLTSASISSAPILNAMFDEMISYFANGRYYKIDGKPVVGVFGLTGIGQIGNVVLGASDANKNGVKAFFDALEARYGFPLYFVSLDGTTHPYWNSNSLGYVGALDFAGFDASSAYYISSVAAAITPSAGGGTVTGTYPSYNFRSYADSREIGKRFYNYVSGFHTFDNGSRYTNTIKAWYPMNCGRNYNAWIDKESSPTSTLIGELPPVTYEDFRDQITDALEVFASNNAANPHIVIYAWNEYGEGGALCPTPQNNGQYLKALIDTVK